MVCRDLDVFFAVVSLWFPDGVSIWFCRGFDVVSVVDFAVGLLWFSLCFSLSRPHCDFFCGFTVVLWVLPWFRCGFVVTFAVVSAVACTVVLIVVSL